MVTQIVVLTFENKH